MSQSLRRLIVVIFLAGCLTNEAQADAWLPPGDEGLRHDIELLADAGILRGPVTTWPLSWPDIARDALAASFSDFTGATADALLRVQRIARVASDTGFTGAGIRLSAAHEPLMLRGFADTPREEGEVAMRAGWLGDHVALNLQGEYVIDPVDGKQWRADGSYLGVNIGNFMISAGFMERWWGPGWDGSLILSTNARPIPSLTLERNYTDPFKTKWLSWIGPWRASIAVGEAESRGVAMPDVRFLAMRVNFKPRPWMEFGLTRTAQACGGDRECDLTTLGNLLIGRDNQVEGGAASSEQPGNQMAGYDLRLRSPWRPLPLVFYTQWIGEDEAGGFPSRFLGLFGLETWGDSPLGGFRLRAEYADTACNFPSDQPYLDCAYRNGIYPQGYTYRGRVIGHSMDNDSRMYSFGGILARPGGDVLSVTVRRVEINRNGGFHAISEAPLDLDNVELRYSRTFDIGKFSVGAGYDHRSQAAESDSEARGFVTWQQGF
ncbi:MAG TPA: capsule assembly Wzi family protein [Steroidobacteraceae bacterium]